MHRALMVMAKEPSVGRTKTRLSPSLTGQQAMDLYRCLLLDTLELMKRVEGVRPIIAYLPSDAESFFRRLAPSGFDFVPQVGDDLGERLDNVLAHCLQTGYDQAVVMDSDSLTLPLAHLRQDFRELYAPAMDVVPGPSVDGGYYLIGQKSPRAHHSPAMGLSTAPVLA